jgi:phosphohistidine phosphatase
MELFILRHGEAGKRLGTGNDAARSLTVAGQKEVEEVAESLTEMNVKLDFIVTSPLKRALQTAEIVAGTLKVKKNGFEEWDELKPEGNRQEFYRRLSQFKQESSVMVVGHEPYLSTMISELIFNGNGTGQIVLKKAGLAKIGITALQPKVKGKLRWLLPPRHMKKMV